MKTPEWIDVDQNRLREQVQVGSMLRNVAREPMMKLASNPKDVVIRSNEFRIGRRCLTMVNHTRRKSFITKDFVEIVFVFFGSSCFQINCVD